MLWLDIRLRFEKVGLILHPCNFTKALFSVPMLTYVILGTLLLVRFQTIFILRVLRESDNEI